MEKFSVGDTVTIVPQPNEACPFHWSPLMSAYCGETARIVAVRYSHDFRCSLYKIDIDDGRWNWDAGCFQEVSPLQEVPADEFLSILTGRS